MVEAGLEGLGGGLVALPLPPRRLPQLLRRAAPSAARRGRGCFDCWRTECRTPLHSGPRAALRVGCLLLRPCCRHMLPADTCCRPRCNLGTTAVRSQASPGRGPQLP